MARPRPHAVDGAARDQRYVAIGMRIARQLFAKRGNHSEVHLPEAELAALLAFAAERGAAVERGGFVVKSKRSESKG